MFQPTRLIAALALVSTAAAAPEGIHKSADIGGSTFGMKLTADATVRRQNGRMTSEGDISFKARLFGGSVTFRTDLEGSWGNGQRFAQGDGSVNLLGMSSFSFNRTKDMTGDSLLVSYSKTLFDDAILEVEKQFTVWSVPCIVMADVTAYGEVGGDCTLRLNNAFNQFDNERRVQVYTALGSRASITAGPGTDLAGVGVYGRIKLGELRMALEQDREESNFTHINHNAAVAEFSSGDFEIGITAWFAGIEESVAIMSRDGHREVLKKVIF